MTLAHSKGEKRTRNSRKHIKNISQPLLVLKVHYTPLPPVPPYDLWSLYLTSVLAAVHRGCLCCWSSHSVQLRLWTGQWALGREQTLPCMLTCFFARPPFLSHARTRCPSPPPPPTTHCQPKPQRSAGTPSGTRVEQVRQCVCEWPDSGSHAWRAVVS